jgi:O-antigen/teichoic acid export membrane protein
MSLARRPLLRSIATVATGTAAAQAVTLAFAPIVTRLYGPEAYGLQGIFMSVVTVLTTVAALGYPTAIVLPAQDADARRLVRLSLRIGAAMSVLVAAILAYAGPGFLAWLNAEAIAAFLFLIPVAMFVSVLGAVLGQWLIREKAYRLTAGHAVATATLLGASKAGFGLVAPTAMVLIATNLLGTLLGTLLAYARLRHVAARRPPPAATGTPVDPPGTLWALARRHGDFPLLRTPQNLINAVSQSLPLLLLASYFGAGASGQYAIAITVLGVPAVLIGGSVAAVFYPRITEAIRAGEDARSLILRATTAMAATGALPFLAIVLLGPALFSFVFGARWETAGLYAQWLAPWLFLQYVNKPAVAAIPALRLQGGLLAYEVVSTGTKLAALYLGYVVFEDEVAAIALFSAAGVIAYAWLIVWVIRRSAKPITGDSAA